MGIIGLRKLIEKNAPGAIKKIQLESLAGKTLGVDASIGIYELYYIGQKHSIIGSTGMPINHIQGIFHRVVRYLRAGVAPVFIFDGKPPELKSGVIAARSELKKRGKGVKVPQIVFTDVMRLLQLMKIPYVQSPAEAEAQAAVLCANGAIDAVVTTDADVLTFGSKVQIIESDGSAVMISRDVMLQELGITQSQFVDLCILLGSDYTSAGLPGIGAVRSLKLLKQYGNIENIIVGLKLKPPAGFTYVEARAEFAAPNTVKNIPQVVMPIYTEAEISAIEKFLLDSGLSQTRFKKALLALKPSI